MSDLVFVGIDVGLSGGIVAIDSSGKILKMLVIPTVFEQKGKKVIDLPTVRYLVSEMSVVYPEAHYFIEKVSSMPGPGVASVFKFGRCYGHIEAMVAAFGLQYDLVPPVTWAKVMHKGMDKKMKPKDRSLLVLKRNYPGIDLTATPRSTKPHEGLMDALLIAEYGRRTLLGDRAYDRGQGSREMGRGRDSYGHSASNDGRKNGGVGSSSSEAVDLL